MIGDIKNNEDHDSYQNEVTPYLENLDYLNGMDEVNNNYLSMINNTVPEI